MATNKEMLDIPAPSGAPQTPTIAGSSISGMSEVDEKDPEVRTTAKEGDSASVLSSTVPTIAENGTSAGPAPTDTEKHNDLAKHATATSQAGHPVQQTLTRDDGSEYPTGVKLGLITLALCLSVFLMALDNSIIATAIPKITDQFHSLSDVGWYGSAYLLTTAALQLLFGKFYTFFSIKWVYLIAILIFELGSLICGVAQNSVTLIIGRAVAGIGSAGIFSGALIILAHSVPLPSRPMYTGFIGSMYGIASVSGPLLGGVFTDKVTWRWCFFINLPIGAITVLVIAIFFPDPHRKEQKFDGWANRIRHFDPYGTAVFMPAIICLLLALQWGGTKYAWDNGRIIALFVVFAFLILVFLGIQWWQQDFATVPPRIIRKRTVWSGSFYAFCTGAAFLTSIYFLPLWFQSVMGASAVDSGIKNLPMLIALVLISVIAGIVVTLLGYYTPFMILSTVLMSVGYGLISTFTPHTSQPAWIGYQILAGAGVGFGMQQPIMAVQVVLDIADVPTGTSVVVFMQTLGGALFVSVANTVFSNGLVDNILAYVPGLDPKVVLAAGATGVHKAVAPDMVPGVILAYNDALTQTFLVSAGLAAASAIGSAFIEWRSVKGKNVEMAAA